MSNNVIRCVSDNTQSLVLEHWEDDGVGIMWFLIVEYNKFRYAREWTCTIIPFYPVFSKTFRSTNSTSTYAPRERIASQ